MRRFLWVISFIFIAIIVFYLIIFNYDEAVFSKDNMPYSISIMIATIGLLVCSIFLQMGKLKKSPISEIASEKKAS